MLLNADQVRKTNRMWIEQSFSFLGEPRASPYRETLTNPLRYQDSFKNLTSPNITYKQTNSLISHLFGISVL